ncbi:MAG TPA: HEPN domain-containing protein [Solirubrobacterales bacterium]
MLCECGASNEIVFCPIFAGSEARGWVMSPRSDEYLGQARDRLADAQKILNIAHPAVVVNTAYYAMLNAANAALSERGEHAKTHSGTWTLFSKIFVAPGVFDQELSAVARQAKEVREKGDYDAVPPDAKEALTYVEGATDFLAAIEALLSAPGDPTSDGPDSKD